MPRDALYIDLDVEDDPALRSLSASSSDERLMKQVQTAFDAVVV
jgi:hypothetical protein